MRHPLFLVMLLINSIHILKVEARKRITTMGKLGVSAHFTSGCFKCFSIIFLYAIFKRYFKKVSYGVYYYFLKNAFKKFYKTFFFKRESEKLMGYLNHHVLGNLAVLHWYS
jgi:hypothetical protein